MGILSFDDPPDNSAWEGIFMVASNGSICIVVAAGRGVVEGQVRDVGVETFWSWILDEDIIVWTLLGLCMLDIIKPSSK